MSKDRVNVTKINELQDGEPRKFEVDGEPVFLLRKGGTFQAFACSCPHHGANLSEGLVKDGHVMCPWHHAVFNLKDGNLEEPPGMNDLPDYEVEIEGDDVFVVRGSARPLRTPSVQRALEKDSRRFVIVGSGAAGNAAVVTLRKIGFRGEINLVTKESDLPYDRTLLSKEYLAKSEELGRIPMTETNYLKENDVNVIHQEATELNAEEQTLSLANGETLSFDKLLLATGANPVRLEAPGGDLDNVFVLRTLNDAKQLIGAAKAGRHAVIVGASFIGLECAAALRQRDVDVAVVAPETLPFGDLLGEETGKMFKNLHEKNGVAFHLGRQVKSFEGDDFVKTVQLDNGDSLDVDFVVLGVGVKPATSFIDESWLNEDGGLSIDANLRVEKGSGDIFAAGDVAAFQYAPVSRRVRVEHWRVAEQMGVLAAKNMMGVEETLNFVPMFWTDQYDLNLCHVGWSGDWDETIIDGDLSEEFIVHYLKDDKLVAAAGKWRDKAMCLIETRMRADDLPSAESLRKREVDWLG